MAKHSSHILQLARKGAEARLRELVDEAKMLVSSFPHLRDSFDQDELPVTFILKRGAAGGSASEVSRIGPRRKKRTLSAAARKAISNAQKKRWAKVKRASKETGSSGHRSK
jgi:hypothetical protein